MLMDRAAAWPAVALSVVATYASAQMLRSRAASSVASAGDAAEEAEREPDAQFA
jgi:hypothetical protein